MRPGLRLLYLSRWEDRGAAFKSLKGKLCPELPTPAGRGRGPGPQ